MILKNEAVSFASVFQNLELGKELQEIFENTTVSNIKILKHNQEMEIVLENEREIKKNLIKLLEKEICRLIPGIEKSKVTLILPKVGVESLTSEEIHGKIKAAWHKILEKTSQSSPLASSILSECDWELKDNDLIINITKSYCFYIKKRNFKPLIEKAIQDITHLKLNVNWREQSELIENQSEKLLEEAIENTLALSCNRPQVVNTEGKPIVPQVIGKPIKDDVMSISSINDDVTQGVIEGQIIAVEAREIKNNKYIVTFDITDLTNSLTVKFFIKKDVFENEVKSRIQKGSCFRIRGKVEFDTYMRERVIMARDIVQIGDFKKRREDNESVKRVELHLHTQMSRMDATHSVKDLVAQAAKWGHKAIAITDHGVVQAFPDAAAASKKLGIKILYGVEAYVVDDLGAVVQSPKEQTLQDTFVVFDIETTGLKPGANKITEIGAVKMKNGEVIEEFQSFVNPGVSIPEKIVKLTGITDQMVKGAPSVEKVLPEFLNFIGDSCLVAHNSGFDMGFIRYFADEMGIVIYNSVIDTLGLSRTLLPHLRRHRLNLIAEDLGITLENHHRAVDDARATAEIFQIFVEMLTEKGIVYIKTINSFVSGKIDAKQLKPYHGIIIAKTQQGLKNLYQLITKSHIDYFFRTPRIPKSEILNHREGLILGTACEAGELYQAILQNNPEDTIEQIVNFYDYLEIQPLKNNQFMIDKGIVESEQNLVNINKKIVQLGEKYNKLVVGTCDTHFLDPEDEIFRKIIMKGQGFDDADNQPPLYLRTTKEMLEEFSYLGKDKAYEIVVTNTNKIADSTDHIIPVPEATFPPKLEGSEDELISITYNKAKEIYGEVLPETVQERLDREINSIVKNGFAVLYIISQKLVWKSLEDGYLVGSRGSVGSSFAATMAGITEVNPLPPHYICPNKDCKYSDFNSEVVVSFAGTSGCDMPDKKCPKCETQLVKEGHDIPFETFLGFDGDKEPDIDLNFSGEYQARAHAYTEELFGSSHVFKAGTIGTLADKTAYGFVQKYLDEKDIIASRAETTRLIQGCVGIKRTTGQHPGGLIVVPIDNDIHNFCPLQRPANDMKTTITTTHFDYHSISECLLKLDILGHDDPTIIRMLEDLTGIDATTVPLDDKQTMSLFTSTKALGIEPEDINSKVASLAVPEFGTKFVRQMLVDTKPTTFSELIRISGLSHGTDVWLNNAQNLVRAGTATLSEVISTRDDIMVYLIIQGVDKKEAFKIMESVRKGKGLSDEQEEAMIDAGVPNWYIDSCKKIKYMFPKAHAAAYVMMAFRIAYFKVHHPECFYATYFSIRARGKFDYSLMCKGKEKVQLEIENLENAQKLTATEKDTLTVLEVVREMYARGIQFIDMDLYESDARKFLVKPDGILPPFNTLQGLGDTVADNILIARDEGEFLSLEEFRARTKASKTTVELMKANNMLQGIQETNQLSFF
ncbi:MAG TPA: PolC-type DNA polymerase III [Epulopiscium sp.]|nr:PolC-type DNA polymerase III [Candidatus Epulonipiscium sp.]